MQNKIYNDSLRRIKSIPYWRVLPSASTSTTDSTINGVVLDTVNGRLYSNYQEIIQLFENNSLLFLYDNETQKQIGFVDVKEQIIWNTDFFNKSYNRSEVENSLEIYAVNGIDGWLLPTKEQLNLFNSNTVHSDSRYIIHLKSVSKNFILADGFSNRGQAMFINLNWRSLSWFEIVVKLYEHDLSISRNINFFSGSLKPKVEVIGTANDSLMRLFSNPSYVLKPYANGIKTDEVVVVQINDIRDIDWTPCRLPKLNSTDLHDSEKGLWELFGEDKKWLKENKYVARDPIQDVSNNSVAIDFGTSSTVVAIDARTGARELLRIGVRDFYQKVEPKDFENPTVLEFLDYESFADSWFRDVYRPELDWSFVRASHEAQASYRDNSGSTEVLASIFPKLKQWALRSDKDKKVQIVDRKGKELLVPRLKEINPQRGEKLSPEEIFDPIALYAWYLGMSINWRGRQSIFLKYYLSFPVKYPLEVKNKILASFRRGLQKSLPDSLIKHNPEVLNRFSVVELASEPAAYAAAALRHLKIQPTDEGVPYAVFDFGGGTTDFDYGILRWATEQEEDEGDYERVFEHIHSSGDNFLGGENLLEHMVYESFKYNLDVLRANKIQFLQPLDARSFAGSELFLAYTQRAQTNSIMLASILRPFMENPDYELGEQVRLRLINNEGESVDCELMFNQESLNSLLRNRIKQGFVAFLEGLKQILDDLPKGKPIQLLLAGNGCHSHHVQAICEKDAFAKICQDVFGKNIPKIEIHRPLPMYDDNPHAPTAKTGVALGLLQVAPGEHTLLLNSASEENDGQAQFGWYIGRMRRGVFSPIISPNSPYGEWERVGKLQQNIFNLFYTNSPRANTLQEGNPELVKHRLDFTAASNNAYVYVRIKTPNSIEITTAENDDELKNAFGIRVMNFI